MSDIILSINPFKKPIYLYGALAFLTLSVALAFWNIQTATFSNLLIAIAWSGSICVTQWAGQVYINAKLSKYFSWHDKTTKRLVYGVIISVTYSIVAYLVVQIIMILLVKGKLPENLWQWGFRSSVYAVTISLLISLIFTATGFLKQWKVSLLYADKLKAEMLAYKYEALQNQINPHFLFNSFNVLSDLVYEDQKGAVQFIKQLSELFRYVLDVRNKELVSIREELSFIASFGFLLQTRFEDKLEIVVDVKTADDEMIVPMTLQLLVENCVKHNEISSEKPLHVRIIKQDGYIVVTNNRQAKRILSESKQTGLANIEQQYGFFTDKKIKVEMNEQEFKVSIPILNAIQ